MPVVVIVVDDDDVVVAAVAVDDDDDVDGDVSNCCVTRPLGDSKTDDAALLLSRIAFWTKYTRSSRVVVTDDDASSARTNFSKVRFQDSSLQQNFRRISASATFAWA